MALGMPIPGNAAEIFQNGAFFDPLLADIAAAAAWRRRGAWHRLKDNALYLFNEVL